MKIVAIRGKNLASLEGEFVIDFTVEPLCSAGIFAITGSTGAGKSTLLDALCLALFDCTPRMNKAKENNVSVMDVHPSAGYGRRLFGSGLCSFDRGGFPLTLDGATFAWQSGWFLAKSGNDID